MGRIAKPLLSRQAGYHMNHFDPDYACMECSSHIVDLYEHDTSNGENEMWTYCRPCDAWTCHPCNCCEPPTQEQLTYVLAIGFS